MKNRVLSVRKRHDSNSLPTELSTLQAQLGATILEFAIAGPFFLLLLLVSIDFLRLSYHALTVQFVATKVLRQAVVGPQGRPTAYSSQEEWIQKETIRIARSLGIVLSADQVAICPMQIVLAGASCDPLNDNAGGPGDMIAVQINAPTRGYSWSPAMRIGGRIYNISGLVVARNERW